MIKDIVSLNYPLSSKRARLLLNGVKEKEGFVYYDDHNYTILKANPGISGLVESRIIMAHWKPSVVNFLVNEGHFFRHLLAEFRRAKNPFWDHISIRVKMIKDSHDDIRRKDKKLFKYMRQVLAVLESIEIDGNKRVGDSDVNIIDNKIDLNGIWSAKYKIGESPFCHDNNNHSDNTDKYREIDIKLPVNWELLDGFESYNGMIEFKRDIFLPGSLKGKHLILRFLGVDYFCCVLLNGHMVLFHEGGFSPFQADISKFVRYGKINRIRVVASSPNERQGDIKETSYDFDNPSPNLKTKGKSGTQIHHDAKRGGAWFYHLQDGNTGGVWNDISILIKEDVHIATGSLKVVTTDIRHYYNGKFAAKVNIKLTVEDKRKYRDHKEADLKLSISPANFEGESYSFIKKISLDNIYSAVDLTETLHYINAWQPWDQGTPHLYKVAASINIDGIETDILEIETGFRKIGVSDIGEPAGPYGEWTVNGFEVFVRGSNLLPTYWPSEYTEEKIEKDLSMIKNAGLNTIFVHALILPHRFYKAANRHGILIIQIAPLQWGYDIRDESFKRAARDSMREMVDFLYNEPSVAGYVIHNEPDLRMKDELDNRPFDMELYHIVRSLDQNRTVEVFSGHNHTYPGQFFYMDDKSVFNNLPARYHTDWFEVFDHGKKIKIRVPHNRNLPTEFGIQAMPDISLFMRILEFKRVKHIIKRMRLDPVGRKDEEWHVTHEKFRKILEELGGLTLEDRDNEGKERGAWDAALKRFNWKLIWKFESLYKKRGENSKNPGKPPHVFTAEEDMAIIILDILHYGGFKGENIWFGKWRPVSLMNEFIEMTQARQYRIHKDAVENYRNAKVYKEAVGVVGFMFRDADWQAPTWGVVDAESIPKKAYYAYVESAQPVTVTLPKALLRPIKIAGEAWFGADDDKEDILYPPNKPWASGEIFVLNDTHMDIQNAKVSIWVEDANGKEISFDNGNGGCKNSYSFILDLLHKHSGINCFEKYPEIRGANSPSELRVQRGLPAGVYRLKAKIEDASGVTFSTNSYELILLDPSSLPIKEMPMQILKNILYGSEEAKGFGYYGEQGIVFTGKPGISGLLASTKIFEERDDLDRWQLSQGEHFIHHILSELERIEGTKPIIDDIWKIEAEILSPFEKQRILLIYLASLVSFIEGILKQ